LPPEEAAAAKHMAQLQHNMWVVNSKSAALSFLAPFGDFHHAIPCEPNDQHVARKHVRSLGKGLGEEGLNLLVRASNERILRCGRAPIQYASCSKKARVRCAMVTRAVVLAAHWAGRLRETPFNADDHRLALRRDETAADDVTRRRRGVTRTCN
jgi:hypothetical protein